MLRHFVPLYNGTIITNGGYTREKENEVIRNGQAQLVAYGQLFLANPDLPKRFELDAPLNTADPSTFYGGGEKGYTDYSFLVAAEKVS